MLPIVHSTCHTDPASQTIKAAIPGWLASLPACQLHSFCCVAHLLQGAPSLPVSPSSSSPSDPSPQSTRAP